MPWRILVVDDDASVRGLIAATLQRRDSDVVEAGAAEPALEHLGAGRFDLLITNLEMPGRSGLWLLEQAKRSWPGMPVLVVTGGIPADGDTATLGLADAVIAKPFRLSVLRNRVRGLLEPHERDG